MKNKMKELINIINDMITEMWEMNRDTGNLIYYNEIIKQVNKIYGEDILELCEIDKDEKEEYLKENGMVE